MGAMASHIISLTIVYSTVHSGADQRNHQSSASLAFVQGIHRWPVNFLHKWPVTWKMFPFDDVIMARGECKDMVTLMSFSNRIWYGAVAFISFIMIICFVDICITTHNHSYEYLFGLVGCLKYLRSWGLEWLISTWSWPTFKTLTFFL